MENTVQAQNTTIKAVKIPRIAEYKAKQELFVQNNPFIPCVDNESYKRGKIARTKYVTERTSIEKHVDGVNKDINTLKSNLKDFKNELIEVTLVHEQKQQAEVKRYEQQKADEKAEKLRLAEEKKQIDIDKVNSFFLPLIKMVMVLIFDEIDVRKQDIGRQIREKEIEGGFGEAEELFIATKKTLIEKLTEKIELLNKTETHRVESERLRIQKKELEDQKAELDRLAKIENDKRIEEQKKLDEEKAEFEAKKEAEQKAIDDEKKRLEKIELDRLAKIEAEKQAKLKAEKEKKEAEEKAIAKAKKDAELKAQQEAEEKRQLALRPDVEKLETAINQISFPIQELSQTTSKQFQQDIIQRLESFKEELINELQNL